jgi:hypothetical protein
MTPVLGGMPGAGGEVGAGPTGMGVAKGVTTGGVTTGSTIGAIVAAGAGVGAGVGTGAMSEVSESSCQNT